MNLNSKRILVTGGAVRLGAAIVRKLSEDGARIIIQARSSVKEAEQLRSELAQNNRHVCVVQSDLDSDQACSELFKQAEAAFGGLDAIVNNAAAFDKVQPISVRRRDWLSQLVPNLFAPYALTMAFVSHIRKQTSPPESRGAKGRMVNIIDRRLTSLEAGCVPYLLSKKMLWEVTQIAAREFAPDIAVNAVGPGAILPPPGAGKNYLTEKGGRVPLNIQCDPHDVADAVAFLLQNDTLTGQILFVDGGQHLLGSDV